MIQFRNPYNIEPPGAMRQILSHPVKENGVVELAIFQEHRYAFFYWNKWFRKGNFSRPPCLVSLDWHQDLCYPCETEKEWLKELNLSNDGDISIFSWAKLAGNNDGHILSAAYLNLIGDIYVHCRQESFIDAWKDEELIDIHGNIHKIKKFKNIEDLENTLVKSDENHVFFDIDLDFFVLESGLHNGTFNFTYLKEEEINKILNYKSTLINWIFERLVGFTIATEPEHCGGLLESNKFLDLINKSYFNPGLFKPESDWKWKTDK